MKTYNLATTSQTSLVLVPFPPAFIVAPTVPFNLLLQRMPEEADTNGLINGGLRPHFLLVPFLAQGHTIPMVDIAHLLAHRGVDVTFVTTPVNAARIRAIIDGAQAAGLPIHFLELPFPCAAAGLPEGCENVDLIPSRELVGAFFDSVRLLREPLMAHLRQRPRPPDCVISDMCHTWTLGVADELGVPRVVFLGTCCFPLLCIRNIHHYKVFDGAADEHKPFVVPGLPHRIEITKAQTPQYLQTPAMEKLWNDMHVANEASYGALFNSFSEMEFSYIERYRKATGKKTWAIGPVGLHNKYDVSLKAARGNKSSDDGLRCLAWLETMSPETVIYVSFGSIAHSSPPQLIEIGAGLEASNRPFAWVIKPGEQSPELETWLAGGFEERTKGRGFVIRGWAPQVAILSHPAVGGFITHCGWNSSVEGISAGVPMITWPHFAEQFLNERLVVDVLGVGVAVGVKTQNGWMAEGQAAELVKRDAVAETVRQLMDGGEQGERRRRRARELGEKARAAMEVGGSSYEEMTCLIRDMSLKRVTTEKTA